MRVPRPLAVAFVLSLGLAFLLAAPSSVRADQPKKEPPPAKKIQKPSRFHNSSHPRPGVTTGPIPLPPRPIGPATPVVASSIQPVYSATYIQGRIHPWGMNHFNPWTVNQVNPWMMNQLNPWAANQVNPWMMNQVNPWMMNQVNPWGNNLMNPWMVNPLNPFMMNQFNPWALNQVNPFMRNQGNWLPMNPLFPGPGVLANGAVGGQWNPQGALPFALNPGQAQAAFGGGFHADGFRGN